MNQKVTFVPCENCKDNHKCGIQCDSLHCLDEKCGCKAKPVAPGMYCCEICGLVFEAEDNAFRDYFLTVKNWYDEFCSTHDKMLSNLNESKLSQTLIDEQTSNIYALVDAFCMARSNICEGIHVTMQLKTTFARKNAYALMKAFENLKKAKL